MCFIVQCAECGLQTWAGCGQHINAIMSSIPADNRCSCGSSPDQQAPGVHRAVVEQIASSFVDDEDEEVVITQVDSEMFVSPLLSPSDMAQLKRLGIKTVIQIMQPRNNDNFEISLKEHVLKFKLKYAECVWSDELVLSKQSEASEKLADKVLSLIDAADKPVVLVSRSMMLESLAQAHCTTRKGSRPKLMQSTSSLSQAMSASLPQAMQDFMHNYIQRKMRRAMSRPGMQQVHGQVWISSQPTEDELHRAKAMGIRTVINLRDPKTEGGNLGMGVLPREEGIIKQLGMIYINLPTVALQTPTSSQVQTIIRTIDECEKPVLIHCRMRNRSTAVANQWLSQKGLSAQKDPLVSSAPQAAWNSSVGCVVFGVKN